MKKLIVTGHVGHDPEMVTSLGNKQFAKFSLANKADNKSTTKTDWILVTCNGKLAEFVCAYVKKGTKLLIEGKTNVSAYINTKTKEVVGVQNLYADTIEILSVKISEDEHDTHDSHIDEQSQTDEEIFE